VVVLFAGLVLAAPRPDIDRPLRTESTASSDAAVVIGVENYASVPWAPHALRDAQAFHDFLLLTRGVPSSRVTHLGNVAREEMLRATTAAAEQAGEDGTVWVYFAGHGATSAAGRWLLGVDVPADLSGYEARSLPLKDLREAATSGGARAVLVLDTSFGGLDRSGAQILEKAQATAPSDAVPAQDDVLEWSAAQATQYSGVLPSAHHGAFTYAVIGALRGWADGATDDVRDGRVTADEAQRYVEGALRALGVEDQSPVLSSTQPAEWVLAEHEGAEEPPSLGTALPGGSWVGTSGYRMLTIPPGSFTMGSPSSEPGRGLDEQEHTVKLTSGFLFGEKEVTQQLWRSVMGENPTANRKRRWNDRELKLDCRVRITTSEEGVESSVSNVDDDFPVMCVDWCDSVAFANKLSEQDGLGPAYAGVEECESTKGMSVTWDRSSTGYRLPTEAEWEYAARAGEHRLYAGAESEDAACAVANVHDLTSAETFYRMTPFPCSDGVVGLAAVGSFGANAWGLLDITGNVSEWCWDGYDFYSKGATTDPEGNGLNPSRIFRGGSFGSQSYKTRLAYRSDVGVTFRDGIGLRLARSSPRPPSDTEGPVSP